MKIICSWCKKLLGEKEPSDDPSEIHAKCAACIEKQKHQEQFRKKIEAGQVITLENGMNGYISVAGQESPKLSLWEIVFSNEPYLCMQPQRKEFEKYLATLPGDEVDVTWLHSIETHMDLKPRRRGKKKAQTEPPLAEEPKKEDVHYNCTIRVSKQAALAIFDSRSQRNLKLARLLMDMGENQERRENANGNQ